MTGQAAKDTVLITGASSGIGLETAIHLAESGFQVCATMRDPGRRDRLESEAARRKVRLQVLPLDVTDESSIDTAVRTVATQYGGIYGLVNNAGVQLRGYFEDLSVAEIRRIFEVNVLGSMAVTRAALPFMRAARRGRILFLSSVGGKLGSLALTAYCATKFALEGFAESLAQELRPFDIQVVLVEPAIVKTEIWDTNRGVAQRALDPTSPYSTWFRASEQLADRLVESSQTQPADVAKAVQRALTARRPRLRYLVGRRAGLVVALRRYLPDRIFEWLYFGAAVRQVTRVGQSLED